MRLTLWIVLFLGGCSSSAVRCDAHLTPINVPSSAPAPAGQPTRTAP
jgi:hypothetical protein